MATSLEPPECLSINICDDVYRDVNTGKTILVGPFNRIMAQTVPCLHPQICVFFTLTNGMGKYDMSVSVEHAETQTVVVEMAGPMALKSPLQIADFDLRVRQLPLPAFGKYWVSLKIDGAIIKQRPFHVESLKQIRQKRRKRPGGA